MKKTILILFGLLITGYIIAQKHISIEAGGSGGIGSINFENRIISNPVFALDYRLGFSFAPIDKNNGIALIFPVMIHGVIGQSKHKLDVGIGQSISVTTKGHAFILMPASIGYRLQPEDKKYYLRFAYTPIVSYLLDFQYQHWAGISFGYKFQIY